MPSLPSLSTCRICGFDETVHLRPCTAADIVVAAVTTPVSSQQQSASLPLDIDTTGSRKVGMGPGEESQSPMSPSVGKAKYETYEGQCHCGKVAFSVKLSPPVEEGLVTSCNCKYLIPFAWTGSVRWKREGGKGGMGTCLFVPLAS